MKEFNQISAVMNIAMPIFFLLAGLFGLWLSSNRRNTEELIAQEGEADALKRVKIIKYGSILLLVCAGIMTILNMA